MAKKVKGIGLLSGGLDSMLAVKVLQEQDIELLGITFETPFFSSEAGIEAGRKTGIDVLAIDISQKHLEMLKSPRYGYGGNMNPCIDCHGLMLREAAEIMVREGADFLFTGEVLGQRPMSQRRDSMRSVEKLSGVIGRVLRPLSAKLLTPTLVETEGLVDRNLLLDIQGRSRRRQTELAAKYGIVDYPQPGGGCLLTSEGYSNRLRELFRIHPDAAVQDVEIIKWGRAFRLSDTTICMVGRQQSDNTMIESLASPRDVLLHLPDNRGPACLMLSPADPMADIDLAAAIAAAYSDAQQNAPVKVQWNHAGKTGICDVEKTSRDSFKHLLI